MDNKKTIMVVDDNPDIITIVKTILEGKGYNVHSAFSGIELLNLLKDQKPDLIILDIMMPEMDGLEVLTRLKGVTDTARGRQVLTNKIPFNPSQRAGSRFVGWQRLYLTFSISRSSLFHIHDSFHHLRGR